MARPITFPRTADSEWTNRETGVQIVKYHRSFARGYEVWTPMNNVTGRQHFVYARSLVHARHYGVRAVELVRADIAKAYGRAERTQRSIDLDATGYVRGYDDVVVAINGDTTWYGNAVRAEMQRREERAEAEYDRASEAYL